MKLSYQAGISIKEVLLTIIGIALLALLLFSSYQEVLGNRALTEIGNTMLDSLESASSKSKEQNAPFFFSTKVSDSDWCYGTSLN